VTGNKERFKRQFRGTIQWSINRLNNRVLR